MANSEKCFDIVYSVIEAADEQFESQWPIDEEKCDILREYCEAIDSLIVELGVDCLHAEVNKEDLTVGIKIECEELTVTTKQHRLYDLIERSVSFCVSRTKSGGVAVEFVFPSVWG